jgi:hypothetical protein
MLKWVESSLLHAFELLVTLSVNCLFCLNQRLDLRSLSAMLRIGDRIVHKT